MAASRHLGLGVIETRWFDERHHTVRPLFEFLSFALKDRSDAFTYERFVGAESFREAVKFIMSGGEVRDPAALGSGHHMWSRAHSNRATDSGDAYDSARRSFFVEHGKPAVVCLGMVV